MLVLTRKVDETIMIGEDVELTVIRIRGNSVRLGISAPNEIRVTRGELDRKPPQRQAAESSAAEPEPDKQESASSRSIKLQDPTRVRDVTDKAKRENRIAAFSKKQAAVPRKIIMGRTTRDPQKPFIARGPLSNYFQNL